VRPHRIGRPAFARGCGHRRAGGFHPAADSAICRPGGAALYRAARPHPHEEDDAPMTNATDPSGPAAGQAAAPAADFWNRMYAGEAYRYGEAPNAFLVSAAHRIPQGARVLLPGDGEGRNGVWLARQGHHVTAVDVSDTGLDKARALAARHGVAVERIVADLVSWDFPREAFDAVVAIFLHLPPQDRRVVHAAMARTLKPGGVLILQAFTPEQTKYQGPGGSGGPPVPDRLVGADDLRADFSPLLTEEHLEEGVTELAEGAGHSGPGAVVSAVFRKPEA
jgi:SAM-dependent methyltransferase